MVSDIKHEAHNYTLTVKINAKGEVSGEYTARADTLEELQKIDNELLTLLNKRRMGL